MWHPILIPQTDEEDGDNENENENEEQDTAVEVDSITTFSFLITAPNREWELLFPMQFKFLHSCCF